MRGWLLAAGAPWAAGAWPADGAGGQNHIYSGERTGGRRPPVCARYEERATRPSAGATGATDGAWAAARRRPWHAWRDAEPADVLYGTAFAQRTIWKHQHPADCSGAKFLAMYHWPIGIGALLHFLGRALGLAMRLGRVLVLAVEAVGADSMRLWPGPGGMPWYDHALCKGSASWECWFEPLTNCTPGDDLITVWPDSLALFRHDNFTWSFVPSALQHLVRDCSRVKRRMEFYWWQAQAVAYIVRFNVRTRGLLDALRRRLLRFRRRVGPRLGRLHRFESLPAGTVAVHVRHGDKIAETPPLPFARYFEAALRLAAGGGDGTSHEGVRVLLRQFADSDQVFEHPPASLARRTMFLSTEDPQVIEEAVAIAGGAVAPELPWQLFYNAENRTDVGVAEMRRERGYGPATLQSFLNLELALEADAWVCTLTSNWCQLIDGLRMTVAAKAAAPFVNLAHDGFRRGVDCAAFPRCYVYAAR